MDYEAPVTTSVTIRPDKRRPTLDIALLDNTVEDGDLDFSVSIDNLVLDRGGVPGARQASANSDNHG